MHPYRTIQTITPEKELQESKTFKQKILSFACKLRGHHIFNSHVFGKPYWHVLFSIKGGGTFGETKRRRDDVCDCCGFFVSYYENVPLTIPFRSGICNICNGLIAVDGTGHMYHL